MILEKEGYAYNDLTIIPAKISYVESRSQCNPFTVDERLPIFTAPMASVVSDKNYEVFIENGITPIIPRNIDLDRRIRLMNKGIWVALSLNEFKDLFIEHAHQRLFNVQYSICVDIANGHMISLYEACEEAKIICYDNYKYDLTIMTGNIANPATYEWICNFNFESKYIAVDYIRVGIGGGFGCITTSNVSTHYPQASLIEECYKIKLKHSCAPKIIADGGIRNYNHVNIALGLGANYVMIGSLFAQCLESAGEKYDGKHTIFNINDFKSLRMENGGVFGYYTEEAINTIIANTPPGGTKDYYTENGCRNLRNEQYLGKCTVKFFGMASADGQKSINGEKTKTAEGITKYLPIEFTLKRWTKNMISYLQSCMSYCNCFTLKDFIGKQKFIKNSISEINSVNK